MWLISELSDKIQLSAIKYFFDVFHVNLVNNSSRRKNQEDNIIQPFKFVYE